MKYFALIKLSQHGLGKVRRHSHQGTAPQPEDGTGVTRHQCRGHAHDVARTHLRSNGGGQGLERTHALLARCLAGTAPEQQTESAEEMPLNEVQAESVEQACAKQDNSQQRADVVPIQDTKEFKKFILTHKH